MVIEQVGNIFRLPTSNYHYRYRHPLLLVPSWVRKIFCVKPKRMQHWYHNWQLNLKHENRRISPFTGKIAMINQSCAVNLELMTSHSEVLQQRSAPAKMLAEFIGLILNKSFLRCSAQ